MYLNDLLIANSVDPQKTIVMRHRPPERELQKVLPWLAAEKPDVFNAYQQTQGARVEKAVKALEGEGYVASFIGHESGKAMFVGLYEIVSSHPMAMSKYWEIPAYQELRAFGMLGLPEVDDGSEVLFFDLALTDFYAQWKGKLIVGWPPPDRSWWRRAHRNKMPVVAVLEDSLLVSAMPEWDKINLTWRELSVLPSRWQSVLTQWRGIYFIFDEKDGRGYVGSAYGTDNLLGRWQNYAATGHGGNKLLRNRDPEGFRFTILQRVSPDMDVDDVIRLEASWKDRLHTRSPFGLNEN